MLPIIDHPLARNLLLRSLPLQEQERLARHVEIITLARGDVVFMPGGDITSVVFPLDETVVSLRIPLKNGRAMQTTTIGREGALGSVLRNGYLPAFTRAVVQMGGKAVKISATELRITEFGSVSTGNIMVRYADCLLAQILQSVACNASHTLEQRCARRLLTLLDRLEGRVLPVTQVFLAEMLGVQRTYLTTILKRFEHQGFIKAGRAQITINDREALQASSCECHDRIQRHFTQVLGASFAGDGTLVAFDPEVAIEAPSVAVNRTAL